MKIVVGLGNPGDRYRRTRHNIGFDVVAELLKRFGDPAPREKFDSQIYDVVVGPEKVLLVCPLTFMNLSGTAIRPLVDFYQATAADVLVVCDDLNLDSSRLRLRASGTAGGQKGLDDIIRRLGTNEIARLRVGIGRPPPRMDAADYVLGKFRPDEVEPMSIAVSKAADAVELWCREGTVATMNRFNPAEHSNNKTPRSQGEKSQRRGQDEEPKT